MNNLNKFSRAILAIAIMLCVALPTLAHDFEVGGIYYNYIDQTAKTVAVTYRGSEYYDYSNEYTGSVTIPSSVTYSGTTYSVTEIGSNAFYNCTGLTSVTIGNSVTSIGRYAFSYCDGLTSVTIPNSVTSIGDFAFYDCSGFTEVNISDLSAWCKIDFSNYAANPLYYAKKFKLNGAEKKDLVIPNDITEIKNHAFSGCSGLASITIPNSVVSIGDAAFYYCSGLTSITIPNSVTSIGSEAFYYCSGLTSITIPNSVTSIGSSAFDGCSGLTEVNILDLSAWCKIDFGDSDANPLCYAKKIKLNGAEIKDLVIPNDITKIKDYAFYRCSGLTSITIPNSVTSIGERAFAYCDGLTSITIPNSVTSIGDKAFNCDNLRIVKSLSNTPQQCDDYAFGENPAALLMVPKGSMMSYMIADGWRHFTKIQEFEVEDAVKPVLTIAYPEGGVIKQKVDNGTILELQIVPSNGWKCNSVTFNGVDVTNNLDADGNYNTPSITADSQLSIVFMKDDSGVESTLANDIKVCVNGNTVTILGADEFDDVEIYNTSGINVYNGIEKSITLDSNGIYILTVEGQTFKFAM